MLHKRDHPFLKSNASVDDNNRTSSESKLVIVIKMSVSEDLQEVDNSSGNEAKTEDVPDRSTWKKSQYEEAPDKGASPFVFSIVGRSWDSIVKKWIITYLISKRKCTYIACILFWMLFILPKVRTLKNMYSRFASISLLHMQTIPNKKCWHQRSKQLGFSTESCEVASVSNMKGWGLKAAEYYYKP